MKKFLIRVSVSFILYMCLLVVGSLLAIALCSLSPALAWFAGALYGLIAGLGWFAMWLSFGNCYGIYDKAVGFIKGIFSKKNAVVTA